MPERNINTWIQIADEDLDVAEYNFQGKKYMWAMVMCQQAIEKILKAIYVKQTDKIPEKTHSLTKLAKDTGIIDELSDETLTLLDRLLVYYFGTRYPDKRAKLQLDFTPELVNNTMEQAKEVYSWLKNKL
jgi:HEPN domain-containing protein